MVGLVISHIRCWWSLVILDLAVFKLDFFSLKISTFLQKENKSCFIFVCVCSRYWFFSTSLGFFFLVFPVAHGQKSKSKLNPWGSCYISTWTLMDGKAFEKHPWHQYWIWRGGSPVLVYQQYRVAGSNPNMFVLPIPPRSSWVHQHMADSTRDLGNMWASARPAGVKITIIFFPAYLSC